MRFKTDSSVIAISVKMNGICKMSHCALTGSTGFDMYYNEGEKYKYFTSSAGQIRKKKAVFIKESVWNKIEKTIK